MTALDDLRRRADAGRADSPNDRSGASYNLVIRGLEADDTDEKILQVTISDESTLAEYGDQTHAKAQRFINKERPNHAHVGRSCSRPLARQRLRSSRRWP